MTEKHLRIRTLDSLRGLAALSVVFAHYLGGITLNSYIDLSPLYILKAAHEAVLFFFLLSGYVLVYQYELNSTFNYKKFIILRIFRIYVPYIIAIILGFILYLLCSPTYYSTNFIGAQWHSPLTLSIFLDHLILIHNFNTNSVDTAIWSLVHEMRIALIFPFLLYILRLDFYKTMIIIIFIISFSATAIVLNIDPPKGFNNGYFYTSYYSYIFICGGLIAKHQSFLIQLFRKLNRSQKTIYIIIALFLYTFSHLIPSVMHKFKLQLQLDKSFIFEDILVVIASCYFMIAAIAVANTDHILEKKPLLFFGKISYSLYLIHLLIAAFIYNELHNRFSMIVILICSFICSLFIATLFNKFIERTAAKAGKKIS